ncbi:glycosyltransferase family 2 protein [Cellulomonas bogoriensis]|uniref:Glycosyl transferase family 2 n=1 Tax=Cellulomonas bogoriensis 69B4 = DSM 16987 TaxID=1386082 RepID=A0A0A0BPQ9_9CELL|nr:glycosyltransferase family 2 protein [Cellulomonas bogoriensis]KGM09945.1 glycosyl transferase family 2 [Cellulomonas bogoriensis 69B4 = DSM 16987]
MNALGASIGPDGPWPPVSVVMPVLNEENHLRESVERILANGYPGEVEIALAVGPSHDRTEEIAAELEARHAEVLVVHNPTGRTPAALNAAIRATTHPVVVRVDGHGMLPPGYIRTAVRELVRTGAANVGGQMVPQGVTPLEQAVARAMSSYLGIGGAEFHVGGVAGPVPSVYLGVFRRDVLERLGGFDEEFHRAQDWELNYRIRQAGEQVWFVPELRVTYRPRSTFRALARQFHGSGQWRREVMTRYRETASVRYLAPPAALVGVVGGALVAGAGLATGTAWARAAAVLPAGYAGVVLLGSLVEGRGLPLRARLRFPAVIACMHMSWAWGFLRPGGRR